MVANALGQWDLAVGLLAVRVEAGLAGIAAVKDYAALWLFWAIPLRDLFGAAVWLTGLFGNTVVWRGRTLHLDREGRIVS